METTGKIKTIGNTQTLRSGFKKRELVIITDEQYPQTLMIEFVQDKTDLLNNLKIGQEVTVSIDIRGREWTNEYGVLKYFVSLQGWKVDVKQVSTVKEVVDLLDANFPPEDTDDMDDLPF